MIALVQKGFEIAAEHYRTYSFDQSRKGGFVISPPDVHEVDWKSFDDFLECLNEYRDQTEFLVVGHGNESGIPLPIDWVFGLRSTPKIEPRLVHHFSEQNPRAIP
jgi:hypothetical protein